MLVGHEADGPSPPTSRWTTPAASAAWSWWTPVTAPPRKLR